MISFRIVNVRRERDVKIVLLLVIVFIIVGAICYGAYQVGLVTRQ